MSYNRINYNQVLYNASPEDFSAFAKSIIQAHTGPHIQAVVGSDGGLSFISDFNVIPGPITTAPTAFYFPDLSAYLRAVRTSTKDLNAFIRAQPFRDLPASIVPVGNDPVLRAYIRVFNAITTLDLGASIIGAFAELDLSAVLQGTEYLNLAARVFSQFAPDLRATIGSHAPADLGAIIWAPEDLPAIIRGLMAADLPATIVPLSTRNLGGRMTGIPAPNLRAYLRVMQTATKDLSVRLVISGNAPDLSAYIRALNTADSKDLRARVGIAGATADLGAYLLGNEHFDLAAALSVLSATNLHATITGFGFGEIIRDLRATLQSVHVGGNLAAMINPLLGLANLNATISSFTTTKDLGARLIVDETFITSILTIITLSSANLSATIGNPACGGGSAIKELGATALAQAALNLGAVIQSFREINLGAVINSSRTFRAFDTIDVAYTRYSPRPKKFRFTDTIDVKYVPFRGATLSAMITAVSPVANLGATLTATFPLLKFAPFHTRVRAIDLRANPLEITDIRVQLEGQIVEYIYVQGIDYAFVKDPDEQWRINIRSFKELASNIFGDHEVARICRLGSLETFATIDEAVRFCITSVLGLNSQDDLGASIRAVGGFTNLRASLTSLRYFGNLGAVCNRVFPSELLSAAVAAVGGYQNLSAILEPFTASNMAAVIAAVPATFAEDEDLGAEITPLP